MRRRSYLGLAVSGGLGTISGCLDSVPIAASQAWKSIEFQDARSGEAVTVESFNEPVVLHTFAIWCMTCAQQHQEFSVLYDFLMTP